MIYINQHIGWQQQKSYQNAWQQQRQ